MRQAFEDVGPRLGLAAARTRCAGARRRAGTRRSDRADRRAAARAAGRLTMASVMTPNVVWNCVCLNRLFSTTSGHFALLQLDDDAHAVAIRLVADVGDALEHLLVHQVGDLLLQLRLVDLVGDLGGDDLHPIALADRLELGLGAQRDRAAAGGVGRVDAGVADDDAAAGEVGPGDRLAGRGAAARGAALPWSCRWPGRCARLPRPRGSG